MAAASDMYGLGATALANAIFRQEGVLDSSGNWIPSSLGYRLNNPGNLNFAGQPGATPTTSGNGQEAQFDTLADGIAATQSQLAKDAARGLTLAERLQTWATGNQAAYISNVSGWLGVDPNTPLSQLVNLPSSSSPAPPDATTFSLDTPPPVDSTDPTGTLDASLSPTLLWGLGIAAVALLFSAID
jgi:hypothetical protein